MTDFTHRSYLELLAFIQSLGYRVGSFRDVIRDQPEQFLVLRHDIDFSLEKALEMAELDHGAGVTATVFILLTAPYYNALSVTGGRRVREIAALGHEIGLHLDLTGFELLSPDEQQQKIALQATMLADVTGEPVCAIAQHKPASATTRVTCPTFVDAYDRQWFGDIGYISDSRMRFVEPDVRAYLHSHPRSQMLIHPLWWNEKPLSLADVFSSLAAEQTAYIQGELAAEEASIRAYLARTAAKSA